MAVAAGAVSSLSTISGQVATTDLQPGEQLLASRFVDPASLAHADDLRFPRASNRYRCPWIRSGLSAGTSLPGPRSAYSSPCPKDDPYPAQTHLVLHKVLVTKVEGGRTAPAPETGEDPAASPGGHGDGHACREFSLTRRPSSIGAEHGTLWLSLEPSDAVVSGTRVVHQGKRVQMSLIVLATAIG